MLPGPMIHIRKGLDEMKKILFVCLGNICRSPMAEFIMKDLVKKAGLEREFVIDSRATSTEETGNPIHHGTMGIFRKYQIPCTGHRAQQMTKWDYDTYDYLIGMDQSNIRGMMRIAGGDPEKKIYKLMEFTDSGRDVADPWYTGDFEATYRDVSEGCRAFLEKLMKDN